MSTIENKLNQALEACEMGNYNQAAGLFFLASKDTYQSIQADVPAEVCEIRLRQARRLQEQAQALFVPEQEVVTYYAGNNRDGNEGNEGDNSNNDSTRLVTFSAIAGAESLKNMMRENIIIPLKNRMRASEREVRTSSGVLMYGPPGTGKTFFAKALAGELNCPFYEVKSEEISNKYHGESEKALAEIFAQAAKHEFAILFFDEVDALLPPRDGRHSSNVDNSVTGVFLSKTSEYKNILVIGTTNRPWAIDESAIRPERFETMVEVPLPDEAGRLALWQMACKGKYFADIDAKRLAKQTEGYSPADILSLANKAALKVFVDAIDNNHDNPVKQADIEAILKDTAPSVNQAQLTKLEAFAEQAKIQLS